ncbi:LysR family transcriptional regulator [Bacillus benzoevorans]|uniref:DNA-binding transcriptional LysR family regulator n=1 Tax=Bacillus benzoevorans TaxID=1456 RepID=A0A7X0HT83_9BACI|nr:LysR family transcriptional regulator [Bacillus benzoevorans]MBB6446407.1 DNA-binding transcriptional LysR family regulator [Bacillus benzoevorans]
MDIRQLTYFLEVAKQKSMTKAAEVLHVSQPALSKMVKGLEEELGMTLITRTNKSSEVTDVGKIVMEYAVKMNALLNEMNVTLSDLTNLQHGSLQIGIPPIAGSLYFPKVIAEFHKAFPKIKINITEYTAPKLTKKVLEGEIELGIAVLPMDEEGFQLYPMVSEEMKLLVHYKHTLSLKSAVHFKELEDEEFIFYHEDFALHDIIWKQCMNEGFTPNILIKSSQWDFMAEMVAANLGVTILPESICSRVDHQHIKIMDLKPATPWNLAVMTKKDKYVSNVARTFIDFILKNKK